MSAPELAFSEAGHGPTVVLLHGFPLHRGMWSEVVDGLTDTAHVLCPDLPGFGSSPTPPDGTSLADTADGVAAVLDGLGVERAVVAGLSMGGYVALAFAERHRDRLAGLGLLDTKASADGDEARAKRHDLARAVTGPAGARVLHGTVSGLVSQASRTTRPHRVHELEAMVALADPAAVAWAARAMAARPDTHHVLDGLDVPALVLLGEDDELTPLADAERMAEPLGVQPVVVPGVGHLSAAEAPGPVTDALADLVRRSR